MDKTTRRVAILKPMRCCPFNSGQIIDQFCNFSGLHTCFSLFTFLPHLAHTNLGSACFLARFSAPLVLHNVFDIRPFPSENVCLFTIEQKVPGLISFPALSLNQKQFDYRTYWYYATSVESARRGHASARLLSLTAKQAAYFASSMQSQPQPRCFSTNSAAFCSQYPSAFWASHRTWGEPSSLT